MSQSALRQECWAVQDWSWPEITVCCEEMRRGCWIPARAHLLRRVLLRCLSGCRWELHLLKLSRVVRKSFGFTPTSPNCKPFLLSAGKARLWKIQFDTHFAISPTDLVIFRHQSAQIIKGINLAGTKFPRFASCMVQGLSQVWLSEPWAISLWSSSHFTAVADGPQDYIDWSRFKIHHCLTLLIVVLWVQQTAKQKYVNMWSAVSINDGVFLWPSERGIWIIWWSQAADFLSLGEGKMVLNDGYFTTVWVMNICKLTVCIMMTEAGRMTVMVEMMTDSMHACCITHVTCRSARVACALLTAAAVAGNREGEMRLYRKTSRVCFILRASHVQSKLAVHSPSCRNMSIAKLFVSWPGAPREPNLLLWSNGIYGHLAWW